MYPINIFIVVVGILLIIIILIITAYLIYRQIFDPTVINPLPAGDLINLGFVISDGTYPHYYYLSNETNNSCNFYSVNISNNSPAATFKILHDSADRSKFALATTSGNYLHLSSDNNYLEYITWLPGKANNDNIWFKSIDAGNGNIYLQTTDGRNLGFIPVNNSQWSCYQGVQVGNNKYILAVNTSSPQAFYITDLTTPVRPAAINYPFADSEMYQVKANHNILYANCASVVNSSFVTSTSFTNQWTVKFSEDKRAFALSSAGNYLKPYIGNDGKIYFSAMLNTLSDYNKGDYTNWFVFRGNKMVSLLYNVGFWYDNSSSQTCLSDTYLLTLGTSIEAAVDISLVKAS